MPESFPLFTKPLFIGGTDDLTRVIVNAVGDTLYYGTSPNVSALVNDGSLVARQRVERSTPTWIVSAGFTQVFSRELTHAEDTTNIHGIADTALIGAGGSSPNTPSAGEKAALAGTTGTPGSANKFVTDTDARLADDPTNVNLAAIGALPNTALSASYK